jgi:transposase-like protein
MRAKRCPYFNCINVKKIGTRNGRQRYYCHQCERSWTNASRPKRRLEMLWDQYAFDGLTVAKLAKMHSKSRSFIQSKLSTYTPHRIIQKLRTVTLVMDVTYFDVWGILVVIDPYVNHANGENTVLYHATLTGTERTIDYEVATDTIESVGYNIIAVTIDGRRGVRNMLEARGIPVQLCQFHQLMTITRCLTKHPG